MDAGSSIAMTYNNTNQRFTPLGVPHAGFASRGKGGGIKRLSLASAPKIGSISENPADQLQTPTTGPRTSRSHLLAGLRTAPKTPMAVPNSAPYHNTSYNMQTPHHAKVQFPKTAAASSFPSNIHPIAQPERQYYTLPEQVMAPPALDMDEASGQLDPELLQQLYLQELHLAQRQRELQQLINYQTAAEQLRQLSLNGPASARSYPATPVTPQQLAMYGIQQQLPVQAMHAQQVSLIPQEIPGRPGQYIVYNPATMQYTLAYDPSAHVAPQFTPELTHSPPPPVSAIPEHVPATYSSIHSPMNSSSRSISPPKSSSPVSSLDGYRRTNSYGHSRTRSSLSIASTKGDVESAPKSAFVRPVGMPPTPMTGSFQAPGSQRAGEHPIRQPYNPPSLEELKGAGNVNFKARARRSAFNKLVRAGERRLGASDGEGSLSGEEEK